MVSSPDRMTVLERFLGEWTMAVAVQDMPPIDVGARVRFEWLAGQQFLIQRWDVPVPEAPDGIAIIGADPEVDGAYLQHYFDERGIARLYKMRLDGDAWTLRREAPDFSPLGFAQRFTGTFSEDGTTISGWWDACHDGSTWQRDFDLVYTKVATAPTASH